MDGGVSYRSIGKYKVSGVLGRGSMGIVYKAQDPEIGRTVAIKVLRKSDNIASGQERANLELFRSEARAAGNLRHPNIITVFEVNADAETPYIVMDYVKGEGLDRLISRGQKLEPGIALDYLCQIAAGLDHAHSKGVIHRDIKPSNIRIDAQGTTYLLDFGVALISSAVYGASGKIVGSPAYMSPEQILNEAIDHRSDIFSLAVVAFECFTGKRPFPGKTFKELASNVLKGSRLQLHEVAPELPLSLEAEFEKALARSVEQRFQSSSAMVEAFAAALGIRTSLKTALPAKRKRKLSEWRPFSVKAGEQVAPDQTKRPAAASTGATFGGGPALYSNSFSVVKPRPVVPYHNPGDIFKDDDDFLEEHLPLRRNKTFRAISTFLAVLCLFLGAMLLVKTFSTPTGRSFAATTSDTSTSMPVVKDNLQLPLLGDEGEILALLVSSGSSESRIVEGLRQVQHRRIFGFIEVAERVLRHDSYVIRRESVRVLASLGDKRAVPVLVPHLDDYDPLVRLEVAKALTALADNRALSYLRTRLAAEQNDSVREALSNAISRISGIPIS